MGNWVKSASSTIVGEIFAAIGAFSPVEHDASVATVERDGGSILTVK